MPSVSGLVASFVLVSFSRKATEVKVGLIRINTKKVKYKTLKFIFSLLG